MSETKAFEGHEGHEGHEVNTLFGLERESCGGVKVTNSFSFVVFCCLFGLLQTNCFCFCFVSLHECSWWDARDREEGCRRE